MPLDGIYKHLFSLINAPGVDNTNSSPISIVRQMIRHLSGPSMDDVSTNWKTADIVSLGIVSEGLSSMLFKGCSWFNTYSGYAELH